MQRMENGPELCNTSGKRFLRLVLLLSLFVLSTDALTFSTPNDGKQSSPKVKRVAIIGAGIAGLSLAHALENSSSCAKSFTDELKRCSSSTDAGLISGSNFGVEAQIFDGRPSLNFGAGAGIQLTGGEKNRIKLKLSARQNKLILKVCISLSPFNSTCAS